MRVDGPQTLDDLCATCPLPWCLAQRARGNCVRDFHYWAARLAAIISADECGCDPLTCAECHLAERTWRRMYGPCEHCRAVTGWERDHVDLVRTLAAREAAEGCTRETDTEIARTMPLETPTDVAEYAGEKGTRSE
jgi:hypothetical protein